MIPRKRPFQLLLALTLMLSLAPVALATTYSLNGQGVTVAYMETLPSPPASPGTTVSATDTAVIAGPGGPQIVGNTPDAVGSNLFSTEWIDLHDLTITYRIAGGGGTYTGTEAQCQGSPGCTYWDSAASDARFEFSNLGFGAAGGALQNVMLSGSNVFGASVSDITPDSFLLTFGSAGILNQNGAPDLGTLTMTLDVAQVPLPGSGMLLLTACSGLAFIARRRACNDVNS